jgi:hypothetical protein
MQAAPFPPQPAAHFSAHDAACAKLEPEKVIKQNIVTAPSNLDTFSSLELAARKLPPYSNIILLFKQIDEARRIATNIAKLPELAQIEIAPTA